MNELQQAYEALGLNENASREELEKVFELELKRSRNRAEDSNFAIKLNAYKFIIEHYNRQTIQEMSRKRYKKWGNFATIAERMSDTARQHKSAIIVGFITIVLIATAIITVMNYRERQRHLASLPPIDLSILFLGDFAATNDLASDESFSDALLPMFPGWSRFSAVIAYVPAPQEQTTKLDLAFRQKAIALLSTERPDIYILDRYMFDWIVNGGILEPMDRIVDQQLTNMIDEHMTVTGRSAEDEHTHTYGINVIDTELANKLPLAKRDMIISVPLGSDNKEKAVQFIQTFLHK